MADQERTHYHRLSDRAAGRVLPRKPDTCLVCRILDILDEHRGAV